MRPEDLPAQFHDLDPEEQARLLRASDAMSQFVYRFATSIIIAGPPGPDSGLRNGTGFIIHLDSRYFLGTALHVVRSWQKRLKAGEEVQFQVGSAVLEPHPDRIWSDPESDMAFIPIQETDLNRIDAEPAEPILSWPPPKPLVGDYVLVSGFPGYLRENRSDAEVDLHAISTLLQVTTEGDRHITCQFEREHWISTNWGKVPAPGTDLGGISGAPVLLVGKLIYPLVGMAVEFSNSFERYCQLDATGAEVG